MQSVTKNRPLRVLFVGGDMPRTGRQPLGLDPDFFQVTYNLPPNLQIATQANAYDLIILRIVDSYSWAVKTLKSLRRHGDLTVVLVLSASQDSGLCVEMLDAGADDVVAEDIDKVELAARILAVLRKARHLNHCHGATAGHGNHYYQGIPENILTLREVLVLQLLTEKPGVRVSRAEIDETLSPGKPIASNVAQTVVCSLRRKLGRATIRTDRGIGYYLDQQRALLRDAAPPREAAACHSH